MNYQLINDEKEDLEAQRNLKAFEKLEKLYTNEAYKAYKRAQSSYISVLKKFIKQNVALNDDFSQRYDDAVVFCLDNQFEAWWAFLEQPENQIKVFDHMICSYKWDILNPSEFADEDQD